MPPTARSSRKSGSHSGRSIHKSPARLRVRFKIGGPYPFIAAVSGAVILFVLVYATIARHIARAGNTDRQAFDAIIVLGTPADGDGNPTPQMLDRVGEAVREYDRGIAPRIILSGSAAHNRFVEADVMARIAESQGVPPSMIFEDTEAKDTIQNACNSVQIMKNHGWNSAEVVTSPFHLQRASMIFLKMPIQWRSHAAPNNLTPGYYSRTAGLIEIVKTARYLVWARWVERCAA